MRIEEQNIREEHKIKQNWTERKKKEEPNRTEEKNTTEQHRTEEDDKRTKKNRSKPLDLHAKINVFLWCFFKQHVEVLGLLSK